MIIVDFTANKNTARPGEQIQFQDTSEGDPTSWDWDFGDGTPHSFEQNPIHSYSTINSFNVTLIIHKDEQTDSIVKEKFITVTELGWKVVASNYDLWALIYNMIGYKNNIYAARVRIEDFTEYSEIMKSSDKGQNWSLSKANVSGTFCIKNNILYFAASSGMFSTEDGITWNDLSIVGLSTIILWNNNFYGAIFGTNLRAVSSDGITWNTDPFTIDEVPTDIQVKKYGIFNNDLYIVGSVGDGPQKLYRTTDGIECEEIYEFGEEENVVDFCTHEGNFYITTVIETFDTPSWYAYVKSRLFKSSDGETWNNIKNFDNGVPEEAEDESYCKVGGLVSFNEKLYLSIMGRKYIGGEFENTHNGIYESLDAIEWVFVNYTTTEDSVQSLIDGTDIYFYGHTAGEK